MSEARGWRRDAFGILLIERFPIYVVTIAVEILRMANKHLGERTFEWRILSLDGGPVVASNGMSITPDCGIADAPGLGTLMVVSSFEPERAASKALYGWLRRCHRRGTRVGGVDTGPFLLADAGLLDGCVATVHWEALSSFQEAFPEIETTEALFTIAGNRFTCAGGTATVDLMLNLVMLEHGEALARTVAQDFIHSHIRDPLDDQRTAQDHRWRRSHPALARVLRVMEENLETPLSMAGLLAATGLSRRRLERVFRRDLGQTAMRHYLQLRLNKARQLVLHSPSPLGTVSMACGFASLSAFSRAYRRQFGHAPREHRALFRAQGLGRLLPERAAPLEIHAPGARRRDPAG